MEIARDYVLGLATASSPTSMAIMKRQVYSELHAGLAAEQRRAEAYMLESFERPDFVEGVQAFLERRPPSFERIGDRQTPVDIR
jgi:enoyl-CoA hydratase/carnithine racemase